MSRIGERGEMEALVRAVELGSFSAAARELKLTPSALSKLVTRLEATLNVRLINRTTRHIHATPEGELFVARCRKILAEMEDAETEVGLSRASPRGRLRMHIGVGFCTHQLLPLLPHFFERYPDVRLDLIVEDRPVDIVRENIDITVQPWASANAHAALLARPLFTFDRFTCASPAYVKRNGMPTAPEELSQHPCIGVSTAPDNLRWQFKTAAGPRTIQIVPAHTVNNVDIVYRLALAGQGIARLSEYIVANALGDGRLVKVLGKFQYPDQFVMRAMYPHERYRLPRVAATLDFLTDSFANRPWKNPK